MYGVQRFSITDWLYDAHERNKLYRVDGWNRYAELKPREKKKENDLNRKNNINPRREGQCHTEQVSNGIWAHENHLAINNQ